MSKPIRQRAAVHKAACSIIRVLDKLRDVRSKHLRKPDKTAYYSGAYQSELNLSVVDDLDSIRTFAFYLPQFHRIPENDEWWGEGFTEWTNTSKAKPAFKGHYQPRAPHRDIGYYDLSSKESLAKQIDIAKSHGLTGFAFYYYWFSGKRLLEKPMDILYNNKDLDISYCAIWANENWTRTWDGLETDILVKQEYSESDDESFIKDLKKYLSDDRYLRVSDKPVVVVYAPSLLPNPKKTFDAWRRVAKREGIGEILIWICRTRNNDARGLGILDCIDGEIEFPPHNNNINPFRMVSNSGKVACLYDYHGLVERKIKDTMTGGVERPVHKTAMLGWDNAARRANFSSFCRFSYHDYCRWLSANREYTKRVFPKEERVMFINAWNEWAEGTYLEPDSKYGYSGINATTQVLIKHPCCGYRYLHEGCDRFEFDGDMRVAVQLHLFYPELLPEVIGYLNRIPIHFDLLISSDSEEKLESIAGVLGECNARHVFTDVLTNIGRDAYPFLYQMKKYGRDYDLICHIHTKKSNHQVSNDFGDRWRQYLLDNLFGLEGEDYVSNVLGVFSQYPEVGMVFPETYRPLKDWIEWGANQSKVEEIMHRLCDGYPEMPDSPEFPAGNMFWARCDSIMDLVDLDWSVEDFDVESGQVDGTTAHALERAWTFAIQLSGYTWVNYTHGGTSSSRFSKYLKNQ